MCFPYNGLQIIVNDVHIRYEDQDADPSRSFSVGVMVENISAQSTDEDWVRGSSYLIWISKYQLFHDSY